MTQPPEGSPSYPGGNYPPAHPEFSVPPGAPPAGPPGPWNAGVGHPNWASEPRNGLGLAAMVLGIVGTVLGLVVIGIIPAILAIIFGIIGLRRVRRGEATNRGQATSGLVLGTVGLLLSVLIGVVGGLAVAHRYDHCHGKWGSTTSSEFNHCLRGDAGY